MSVRILGSSLVLAALVLRCASAPAPTPAAAKPTEYLYLATASSGTLRQLAAGSNTYRLQLRGTSPWVTYFSDRPVREAGRFPMQAFLATIGFGGAAAPNAAIELFSGNKAEDIIVVELANPAYDPRQQTLGFDVTILKSGRDGLAAWNKGADPAIPSEFGEASLFIDDGSCGSSCPTSIDYWQIIQQACASNPIANCVCCASPTKSHCNPSSFDCCASVVFAPQDGSSCQVPAPCDCPMPE